MRSGIVLGSHVTVAMLCAIASAAPIGQDRPTYRLETSTSIVHGFRATYQTIYTYYKEFRESKQELWRITLNEKYAGHWIGRNGRLWVLTDGPTKNLGIRMSVSRVWIRDPDANELASVDVRNAMQLIPEELVLKFPDYELDREASGFSKQETFSSQFSLVFKHLGELHINEIFVSNERHRYIVTWNAEGEPESRLEKILFETPSPRSLHPLAELQNWEVWQPASGSRASVLTIYGQKEFLRHRNVDMVVQQQLLYQLPSYVTMTPANRVLWFSFPELNATEEASLFVFNSRGGLIGEVDMMRVGGFKSTRNAKRSLHYTNVQSLNHNNWETMAKVDRYFAGPETIKIVDGLGTHYIITIDGYGNRGSSVVCETLSAEEFLFRKEQQFADYYLIDEKRWTSANGQFTLRIRKLEHKRGRILYRQTLILEDSSGRDYEHELWSMSTVTETNGVFVSDTGRTLIKRVDRIRYRASSPIDEITNLYARDYNGRSTANFNLLSKGFFGTYEEALVSDLSGLSVSYDTPVNQIMFEGAYIPRYWRETYTWEMPDGSTQVFYVARNR